jgi:hypothetical protein
VPIIILLVLYSLKKNQLPLKIERVQSLNTLKEKPYTSIQDFVLKGVYFFLVQKISFIMVSIEQPILDLDVNYDNHDD